MADTVAPFAEVVTEQRQLVEYLASGCKPPDQWRIGTEHEKFVFRLSDHAPVPHEGDRGIEAFLKGLTRYGWQPVEEGGRVIALARDGASVTLEPAGQLELSGAPLENLHQSCREVNAHLREVREVARELDVGLIGLGFHPTAARDEMPWMPKSRYEIMHRYMPTRGNLGLDMMTRSCGVQVNLDFASEADMIRKFRVSLALQPIATALFANSPFTEGRPNGFLSYRAHVWTDTDPDRCGTPAFVFDEGMGFERYTEYALDVPMYFVVRDNRMVDCSGQSFRDFLAGRLPALPGEQPTLKDWEDHLTTLFPEVRIKRFMEQRGTDSGPWGRLCALPAFWVGLLYDDAALDAAEQLTAEWSARAIAGLQQEAARHGLAARIDGRSLQDIAREAVSIARQGLAHRNIRDGGGRDETHFLDELGEIAETGITPAERMLEQYENEWGQSVDPVFEQYAY
ncbi:MAG: glutamate--cysteine ligase [Halofilum sp. (in: g-proteobacteria)]|nr:glutamate--cysteine ligase [Halofilum sp. (in: g-proteobacteria)]